MDLIIWGYIFGGATIFGVIVGIFSVYNGRKTRKEICNLILSESEANRNVLTKISDQIVKISEGSIKISEELIKISEELIRLTQQTTAEHKAMVNALVGLSK